jgi:hypothetical protein
VAVAIVVVAPLEFKPLVMTTFVGTNLRTSKTTIGVSPARAKLTDCADAIKRNAWLVARLVGWLVVVDAGPGFAMIFSFEKCFVKGGR